MWWRCHDWCFSSLFQEESVFIYIYMVLGCYAYDVGWTLRSGFNSNQVSKAFKFAISAVKPKIHTSGSLQTCPIPTDILLKVFLRNAWSLAHEAPRLGNGEQYNFLIYLWCPINKHLWRPQLVIPLPVWWLQALSAACLTCVRNSWNGTRCIV